MKIFPAKSPVDSSQYLAPWVSVTAALIAGGSNIYEEPRSTKR